MEAAFAHMEVPPVIYPDSDGEPMAENTVQYEWIVAIKGGLDALLPTAFVAGDLFWYPVEGDPHTRLAPDVMVALDRPKGHRGSYKQWEEGGKPPDVVFEIWSPGNSFAHKTYKLLFYNGHGVREFYAYDPESNELSAYAAGPNGLSLVDVSGGFTSPLLGVRFELDADKMVIREPSGRPFRTFAELHADAEAAQERADAAQERADAAQQQAEAATARADALAAKLRALGLDPDAP